MALHLHLTPDEKMWVKAGDGLGGSNAIYVCDEDGNRIRKIDLKEKVVSTVAGSGKEGPRDGSTAKARFTCPGGTGLDVDGIIYVGDCESNRARLISAATGSNVWWINTVLYRLGLVTHSLFVLVLIAHSFSSAGSTAHQLLTGKLSSSWTQTNRDDLYLDDKPYSKQLWDDFPPAPIPHLVSIPSLNSWREVFCMDIDLCTLTSFSACFFFLLQLVHRQTPLSCTIHSLTSVRAHLDRTDLESIVFSETSAVMLSSCTHTHLLNLFAIITCACICQSEHPWWCDNCLAEALRNVTFMLLACCYLSSHQVLVYLLFRVTTVMLSLSIQVWDRILIWWTRFLTLSRW